LCHYADFTFVFHYYAVLMGMLFYQLQVVKYGRVLQKVRYLTADRFHTSGHLSVAKSQVPNCWQISHKWSLCYGSDVRNGIGLPTYCSASLDP